jgi:hypothetical protein
MAMKLTALALLLLIVTAQAQVSRVSTNGLVGWWTMEDYGATVVDRSGNGNTGTVLGGTPVQGPLGLAHLNSAAGTNAITIPDSASLRPTAITIAAWVRPFTTVPTSSLALTKARDTSTYKSYQLSTIHNQPSYVFRFELATASSATGNPAGYPSWDYVTPLGYDIRNKWHHLAFTWFPGPVDGSTGKVFFNGAQIAARYSTNSYSANHVITYSTRALDIGRDNSVATPTRHWDGLIDDVRIYNRALSPQEIAALVNSRRRNHSQ